MRPILHGDLVAAARVICPLPSATRKQALQGLLERADAADRFRKRTGRAHPLWGNGSLMGAASACGTVPDSRPVWDTVFLAAMAEAIEAVLAWRQRAATFR
jgi:hypothetical protein